MTIKSQILISIGTFGFWLCGGLLGKVEMILFIYFRGKMIHSINIINFAKSVIKNINHLSVKAGRSGNDTQHYDITFEMKDGLAGIFSNVVIHNVDNKVASTLPFGLMDSLLLQANWMG